MFKRRVTPGFTLRSENTTHILMPSDNDAFLNPVQEFSRDFSITCIHVWSEEGNRAKEARWNLAAQGKKAEGPEKRLKGAYNIRIPCPGACDHIVILSTRTSLVCKPGEVEIVEYPNLPSLVPHQVREADVSVPYSLLPQAEVTCIFVRDALEVGPQTHGKSTAGMQSASLVPSTP